MEGLRSQQGQLLVLVFAADDGFPSQPERAYRKPTLDLVEPGASFFLDSLPVGEVAVTVVHDEDGDGELDTGAVGIPREGVGTSNNPGLRLGPPRYSDAVIDLRGGAQSTVINLRYLG